MPIAVKNLYFLLRNRNFTGKGDSKTSPAGANPAGKKGKQAVQADFPMEEVEVDSGPCTMQPVPSAVSRPRFLSNLVAISQYIAGIATRKTGKIPPSFFLF